MDRDKLRSELIRDEGLRLLPYRDTVGLWTIGVGHCLGSECRMTRITNPEAMALLEADINTAQWVMRQYVKLGSMPDEMERALVNMAFNLGPRLGQFKDFLAAINNFNRPLAANEMMDSKWAHQLGDGIGGRLDRAERLRAMILGEG